jgi:hypothetical protein
MGPIDPRGGGFQFLFQVFNNLSEPPLQDYSFNPRYLGNTSGCGINPQVKPSMCNGFHG